MALHAPHCWTVCMLLSVLMAWWDMPKTCMLCTVSFGDFHRLLLLYFILSRSTIHIINLLKLHSSIVVLDAPWPVLYTCYAFQPLFKLLFQHWPGDHNFHVKIINNEIFEHEWVMPQLLNLMSGCTHPLTKYYSSRSTGGLKIAVATKQKLTEVLKFLDYGILKHAYHKLGTIWDDEVIVS